MSLQRSRRLGRRGLDQRRLAGIIDQRGEGAGAVVEGEAHPGVWRRGGGRVGLRPQGLQNFSGLIGPFRSEMLLKAGDVAEFFQAEGGDDVALGLPGEGLAVFVQADPVADLGAQGA